MHIYRELPGKVNIREKGVLPESKIYFHIPKESDRKMFLTPSSSGRFFCDETYQVVRDHYGGYIRNKISEAAPSNNGSYLCLFVKEGKGFVFKNDHKIVLYKNDAFLLDCYHPHCYGALNGSKLETVWVHFEGFMIRDYFKQIGSKCIVLSSLPPAKCQAIYNNLFNIYENFDKQKGFSDILNNKYLVAVITEFLLTNSGESENNSPWDDLLYYISENVQKSLKLEDLAERMALSPYHFARQFKKKIGYTPHKYVLMTRINTAKHLLQCTSLSIKEIAFACGFSNGSGFCNRFKNMMGVWPTAYRGTNS